jgi:uncharacterized membrane protein YcaP (DUF421 family)
MQPVGELIVKLPFGILFFIIAMRIMGRKEVQQATPLEFACAVYLASIAWDMTITAEFKVWHMVGVITSASIIFWGIDYITYKSKRLEKLVLGKPKLLIKNGEINREVLKKERISEDELKSRLRVLGVFDIETVELAYFELSGEISIKKRRSNNGEKGG